MHELISFYLNLLLKPLGWETTMALTDRLFFLSPHSYVKRTIEGQRHRIHTIRLSLRWFPTQVPLRWMFRRNQYGQRQMQVQWTIPWIIEINLQGNFTSKIDVVDVMETRYWSIALSLRTISLFWNCVVDPQGISARCGTRWIFRWSSLLDRSKLKTVKQSHGQTVILIPETDGFSQALHAVDIQKSHHTRHSCRQQRQKSWSWWYLIDRDQVNPNPFTRLRVRRYPGNWTLEQVMEAYVQDVHRRQRLTIRDIPCHSNHPMPYF